VTGIGQIDKPVTAEPTTDRSPADEDARELVR
jgi:hypothetical protein